jgi:hypothetical protein
MPLLAAFDGGRLTSDGGLPWLAEADTLRHDPLFKLVCGRRPDSDPDLASQPSFSRLENTIDRHTAERLVAALVDLYVRERSRMVVLRRILIDVDGTYDPAHGEEEGVADHGFYQQHMYHPPLVFDGDTGQRITVLQPGNVHGRRFLVLVLRRLVRRLRQPWPQVAIDLRADSGCAVTRLYTWCEAHDISDTIGLIPNPRLEVLAPCAPMPRHRVGLLTLIAIPCQRPRW